MSLVLAVLAACGGPQAPQDEAEAEAKGRDTDETVFDDMIQTEDKARGVEARPWRPRPLPTRRSTAVRGRIAANREQ